MIVHPPHIPAEQGSSARAPKISKFIIIALVIGGLSGLVAAIGYSAYGPTATPNLQTPQVLREQADWDEAHIMAAQDATVSLIAAAPAKPIIGLDIPEVTGTATIITSDGWLLTTAANIKGKRVLVRPQTTLPITKIIIDPSTPLAFVKVDAKNLRVLDHITLDKLQRGMQLSVVTPRGAIPVTLQDTSFCIAERCPWEAADRLSYAPVIVEQLPLHSVDGAAVITTTGALVGVAATINNRTVIIPIEVMRKQFSTVFAQGSLAQRGLPVQGINLTRWPVIDEADKLPERGMYVQALSPMPAGRYTGVFTDLKEGDIITAVEREPIQAATTLFGIVRAFESQPQITMTVLRKGESRDVLVHFVPVHSTP